MRREPVAAPPVHVESRAAATGSRYLIPWLLLFAGSGCAALIYERARIAPYTPRC
jgi:hypothetical protein